jgi:peptidylprolyl isomerase
MQRPRPRRPHTARSRAVCWSARVDPTLASRVFYDARITGAPSPLERPQIDKPEGDIPFELGVEDLVVGEGDEATKGTKVSVHYVGVAFRSGEEFDASWNRGQPFEFKLGKGQVIPGWDAGVEGMRVGGRRKLTIPSAMAYGARGAGGVIQPHEPLVFVVDLLSVD